MTISKRCRALGSLASIILVMFLLLPGAVSASPGASGHVSEARQQSIPDWLTPDLAAQFDIGIDVLVPWSLPSPFGGTPQISTSQGYYSLYWYVGGGAPTLLQIIGQDGGSIPAYSKYDRNVELTANATVQGTTAYHDLTPIYDLVYWQVGSVVYSVESQNSSEDSVTLANSLSVLSVPQTEAPTDVPAAPSASITSPDSIASGDVGTVNVSTDYNVVLSADSGVFTSTGTSSISLAGSNSVDWQAPSVDSDITATFTVTSADDGSVLASTPTLVQAASDTSGNADDSTETSSVDWGLDCPDVALAGDTVTVTASGPSSATLSAADGEFAGGSGAIAVDLGGSVDLDYTAPDDGSESVQLSLLSGDATVATCTIAITTDASAANSPTAEATSLPKGSFPGDATDLSIGIGSFPTVPADVGTATPAPTKDPALIEGDGTGIMEATKIVVPTVPPTATPTRTPKPGQPTDTPVPSKTPVPTKTSTPENPIPTMVPQNVQSDDLVALEIGPAGGELSCPFGVQIVVPKDAFTDMTSVTVQPISDSQLAIQQTVRYVPQSAYDIAFAALDGRGTDLGTKSAEVSIDLKERFAEGATLYDVTNGTAIPLEGVKTDGTILSFETSGPIRVVAGVTVKTAATQGRNLVPLVILALLAVIVLIVAISMLTSLRAGRVPTISNRGSRKRGRF